MENDTDANIYKDDNQNGDNINMMTDEDNDESYEEINRMEREI